jgi:hypothetical protein
MHLLWESHLRLTPQIYDANLEDKPNLMTSAASALYGEPADFAPLVTNNKTRYNT